MEQNYLNIPLFTWEENDHFTIGDAVEGTLCTGGLGSGKTSAFGHLLAGHYLSNKFGFLVLTAKASEKDLWVNYCKEYNRLDDLIIFSPDSGHYFNFLEYEFSRQDKGKGIAHNIADVLKNVIKAGSQDSYENDKAFWDSALTQLLVCAVDLCLLTKNKRFDHIYKIVQSAPRNRQELHNEQWRQRSHCFAMIQHVAKTLKNAPKTLENDKLKRRLSNIENFFLESWLNLSERTRSVVEQMFFGFSNRFMHDPMYELFNTKTTVTPEDTLAGKIILIDLPVLVYEEMGRDAQILWKYLWQRAMQRRDIKPDSRPVCLWVDEFQLFINAEKDVQFQSIAREYRACSVYITQNLPNFYLNAGGGEVGRVRFKALAGNLGTKFFLANSDVETNEYASDLLGRDWLSSNNEGKTFGENMSFSIGSSEHLDHIVEPSEFTKLKTGGVENDYIVQAYVHRQGKIFTSTGYTHKLITLTQQKS